MARVKQHRRNRFLSKDAALRVKAIQEEGKTKTKDPAAAIAAIDAALAAAAANDYDPHHLSWAHKMMTDAAARRAVCVQQFAIADADGGGDLDFKEAVTSVGVLVQYMGLSKMPSQKKLEEWMSKFDKNKDGVLSFDEFLVGFLSVVTSVVKELEFQEAAQNKFDDEQVTTILGYCDDVNVDDVYVEEPRVVVEDDDDEDVRSLWGDGDKNPADVEEE
eukprot:TRINITY_DN2202_c0_g1_i9.p1 TRINITY_DN2202_c0_g1~~TRINITY_DN2202_c0_g1_i9.p1  ORF type:complete len:241 (-),score=71.83 TRINITY_DN2202_c0_g1_i9:102-755(-)